MTRSKTIPETEGGLADVFRQAADIIKPPKSPDWNPLPHQVPPPLPWFVWMLMGGRGTGKTAPCAKYIDDHMKGPPCLPHVPGGHWASIVAPTLGDAVTSCVYGESGIRKWTPEILVRNEVGGTIARWPNGAVAKLFGAQKPDDVERFRAGGNRCFVWAEEMAAWRYLDEAWQQIRYGLRVGPRPHAIISTTPKPRALIKKLMHDPNVSVTRGTTADNPYLDAGVKQALYDDYGGTRMGRQELLGEYLEDIPGSLWRPEYVDPYRITRDDLPRHLDYIVVGVDPSVTDTETSDETGIMIGGMVRFWNPVKLTNEVPHLPHGFLMADRSLKASPRGWANEVVRSFRLYGANRVVAEANNGGDLVIANIHAVDPTIPVKKVHASRGKTKRAEPVATLYEQGRVHHVGNFTKLEDQMYTWDSLDPDPAWSPDRMDAMVWLFTELMVNNGIVRRNAYGDSRLRGRR